MDSREAMASAALTAGWRWWGVGQAGDNGPTGDVGTNRRLGCTTGNLWPFGITHPVGRVIRLPICLQTQCLRWLCWTCTVYDG